MSHLQGKDYTLAILKAINEMDERESRLTGCPSKSRFCHLGTELRDRVFEMMKPQMGGADLQQYGPTKRTQKEPTWWHVVRQQLFVMKKPTDYYGPLITFEYKVGPAGKSSKDGYRITDEGMRYYQNHSGRGGSA